MSRFVSRRDALKNLFTGSSLLALPLARASSLPSMKPHVKLTDAAAVKVGYVEDAGKVNVQTYPTYKPGQLCSSCNQLAGHAGDDWRPCYLFPGKLVAANGWCTAYRKKE